MCYASWMNRRILVERTEAIIHLHGTASLMAGVHFTRALGTLMKVIRSRFFFNIFTEVLSTQWGKSKKIAVVSSRYRMFQKFLRL